VSPIVQGLASSQGAVLFTWMQPLTGSQPSSVQGFPSSQFLAVCPRQVPVAGSHASSVHVAPSSHGFAPVTLGLMFASVVVLVFVSFMVALVALLDYVFAKGVFAVFGNA